jgi:hypothetical protein
MTPGRVRVGRILVFLGTVTLAYFAIGLAILIGASALFDVFAGVAESRAFLIAQLAVGVVLFTLSWTMDSKKARERAAERERDGGGRITRWRARAMGEGEGGSVGALVGLALAAVLVEAASMLPYLAGIGIITAQGPGWPGDAALLLGYCLVMVAPALILTVGRIVARSALEGPLRRLDGWLTRNARSTTAWVVGIVGAVLGLRALGELGGTSGVLGALAAGAPL